jgi:hypothetical protein
MAYQSAWRIYLHLGSAMYHIHQELLGTYKYPSTVETLKTIKQKHDESLWNYVKHFCNARNDIPYI